MFLMLYFIDEMLCSSLGGQIVVESALDYLSVLCFVLCYKSLHFSFISFVCFVSLMSCIWFYACYLEDTLHF